MSSTGTMEPKVVLRARNTATTAAGLSPESAASAADIVVAPPRFRP